jgi:hypothetical protein
MGPGANVAPAVAAAVAAAVIRSRRRILRRLERAGATHVDAAVALTPERRLERRALDYFRRRDVILEPKPGRYFVVPEKAADWRRTVRLRIIAAVTAAAAAAAAVFAINA